MKIYAVYAEISDEDANNYHVGTFSTKEKAEQAIKEALDRDFPIYEPSIDEWELDEPIRDY